MNLSKTRALLTAGCFFVSALFAQSAIAESYKIGLSTINDPQFDLANRLSEVISERTNGELEAEIFPAGQLGSVARQIEGLQVASQEMYLVPPGLLSGVNKAFSVVDTPGLFDGPKDAHAAMNKPDFKKEYLALAEDRGILALGIWSYDMTAIALRPPASSLSDVKGKKIRILANDVEKAYIAGLGGVGVPLEFTELLPALQQGAVDGLRTSFVAMKSAKFNTVASVAIAASASVQPSVVLVSKRWFEGLPEEQRTIVAEAVEEASLWATENGLKHRQAAEEAWIAEGGTIVRITDEDRQKIQAISKSIREELSKQEVEGRLLNLLTN